MAAVYAVLHYLWPWKESHLLKYNIHITNLPFPIQAAIVLLAYGA